MKIFKHSTSSKTCQWQHNFVFIPTGTNQPLPKVWRPLTTPPPFYQNYILCKGWQSNWRIPSGCQLSIYSTVVNYKESDTKQNIHAWMLLKLNFSTINMLFQQNIYSWVKHLELSFNCNSRISHPYQKQTQMNWKPCCDFN